MQTQLRIAGGESLADMSLDQNHIPQSIGYAVQARVNMETMTTEGDVRPSGGTLTAYKMSAIPKFNALLTQEVFVMKQAKVVVGAVLYHPHRL